MRVSQEDERGIREDKQNMLGGVGVEDKRQMFDVESEGPIKTKASPTPRLTSL